MIFTRQRLEGRDDRSAVGAGGLRRKPPWSVALVETFPSRRMLKNRAMEASSVARQWTEGHREGKAMTPLERAARALAEADAKGRANLYDANPELYTRLARAVLMAVREPDKKVLEAGAFVIASNLNGDPYDVVDGRLDEATGNDYREYDTAIEAFRDDASESFTAMIDAILADGGE